MEDESYTFPNKKQENSPQRRRGRGEEKMVGVRRKRSLSSSLLKKDSFHLPLCLCGAILHNKDIPWISMMS
jgi:hypothetical protein